MPTIKESVARRHRGRDRGADRSGRLPSPVLGVHREGVTLHSADTDPRDWRATGP